MISGPRQPLSNYKLTSNFKGFKPTKQGIRR